MNTSRLPIFVWLVLLLASVVAAPAPADDKAKDEGQPAKVEIEDLTLEVPASWTREEPTSKLRLAQFRIKAGEGEEDDAELTIFNFGASNVEDNVRRWIGQFADKERMSKVTQGESPQGKYVLVEVSGTYNKPVGPPVAMKTQPAPNSRMLAVYLAIPDKGVYYLKLVGANETVAGQAAAFRKSFGADAEKEAEFKLDE